MKTTCVSGMVTTVWPSEHLRGAALAGLLCLATVACSSHDDTPTANGSAGSSTAGSTSTGGSAGQQGLAGTEAGATAGAANGAAGTPVGGGGGAAGSGGDAAGGSNVGGAVDAGGAGGVVDAGGAGGAGGAGPVVEPAHITSSMNVGVLTVEQFTALCDERSGTVEVMPHCGGFATAAGFSYDGGTQLLSEHTCAGTNTCGGWNCIVPE